LTLFTAANPAIPAGGFVGESKSAILEALQRGGAPVARFERIAADLAPAQRLERARHFMARCGLGYPVVVKPDAGQRGAGVEVVRSEAALERRLAEARGDAIVQEHVRGEELGVFYYRHPGEERGRIFSITEKRMPVVIGDGRRSLERLVLEDPRAVCMARAYLAAQAARLEEVPIQGETVQLVELGTHARGAIFLDGGRLASPELERAIDHASRGYEGFYFGRYDIRGPSLDHLRRGEAFKIIELNGVTSETTDIYDPRNRLRDVYRKLFRQWRLAFEIGARNREAGATPAGLLELVRMVLHRNP
jgi:hypothetical protein